MGGDIVAAGDPRQMFYWKNAIIIVAMLAFASGTILMLARSNWERSATAKLAYAGVVIVLITVSFLPMNLCEIVFAGLLLACFEKRVPMVATYLFFLVWTPSAAAHLAIAGSYFVPVRPMIGLAMALLAGYALNPHLHLRRGIGGADIALTLFMIIFFLCYSRGDDAHNYARNFVTYVVPFGLTYHVLSRTRIERPELVLRFFLYSVTAAALLCLFEMVKVWPLYGGLVELKGAIMVDLPTMLLVRGGHLRAFGPFSHPLTASTIFGMASVAWIGLLRLRGLGPPLIVIGGAILLGLFAAGSRTGIVALIVGLMTVMFLRRRYVQVAILIAIGAVIVFALPYVMTPDAQDTSAYRMALVEGVPRIMGTRLILGSRAAIDNGLLDDFIQGQGIIDLVNVYLAIAVVAGIASLLPYLFFLGATFTQYRALRRSGADLEQLVLAQTCVGMQAGFMAAGLFTGAWASSMQISFLCVAIIVALRAEVARAGSQVRPKPAIGFNADPLALPALR